MNTVGPSLSPGERRRIITTGLLRGLAFTVVLTVVYYVSPLDAAASTPLWLVLGVALTLLGAVIAQQVRAIVRAPHPAARAVEAVAITGPLFLYLFASAYFVLSGMDASNFTPPSLTRTDALYFTVTVFSTVGFGDITAASQSARVLVTVQMILDLILIGAVVRVFVAAAKLARSNDDGPTPEPRKRP